MGEFMERTKTCKQCKVVKPVSEYHNTGWHIRKDGSRTELLKPACKICANATQTLKHRDMLDSLVCEWKCKLCGYNACKSALEFHHLESSQKDFVIAQRVSISFKRLQTEIVKCVLLCANCHREVHAGIRSA